MKHEETGVLFDTPEEFVPHAKRLLADPPATRRLAQQAQRWVTRHFDPTLERDAYKALLARLTQRASL